MNNIKELKKIEKLKLKNQLSLLEGIEKKYEELAFFIKFHIKCKPKTVRVLDNIYIISIQMYRYLSICQQGKPTKEMTRTLKSRLAYLMQNPVQIEGYNILVAGIDKIKGTEYLSFFLDKIVFKDLYEYYKNQNINQQSIERSQIPLFVKDCLDPIASKKKLD